LCCSLTPIVEKRKCGWSSKCPSLSVLQHGWDRPYRSFLNIRLWTRCDLYELKGKMAAFASEDTKEW
jgi:hypothetical protein